MTRSIASLSSRRIDPPASAARSDSPWGLPDRAGCALAGWGWPPDSRATRRPSSRSAALLVLAVMSAIGFRLSAIGQTDGHGPVPVAVSPGPKADDRAASAGINLLADASSSTLNATSAGATPSTGPAVAPQSPDVAPNPASRPEPPAPLPLSPVPSAPVNPPQPAPEPVPPAVVVPEIQPPPPPVPQVPAPVVEAVAAPPFEFAQLPFALHPEDDPMMRNWTSLGYRAILTALLTAPVVVPVAAAAPPPEKEAPTPEQIDKKMVEFGQAVKADIDGLKKEIEGLKKQLSGIQSDLEKLKQAPGVPSGPGVSTKELEDKLGQLQRELELLRQKLPTTTTVLRPGAAGRLDLVNDFPFTVDFVINERVYPVRGNSTQEVTIPVGSTFTFRIPSVPGYQTSQSRLMGGERPHMLRVHPLP